MHARGVCAYIQSVLNILRQTKYRIKRSAEISSYSYIFGIVLFLGKVF